MVLIYYKEPVLLLLHRKYFPIFYKICHEVSWKVLSLSHMNAFTRVRLREKVWTGMELCVQFNACIVQQHHVEVRLSSRLFLDRHSRTTEVCFLVSSEDQEQNAHWVCGNDDCGFPTCFFVFRQTQNIWLIHVSTGMFCNLCPILWMHSITEKISTLKIAICWVF